MDKILAEISAGELIDKITILEIKKEKILDKEKISHVQKELSSLSDTMKKCIQNQLIQNYGMSKMEKGRPKKNKSLVKNLLIFLELCIN